MTRGLLRDHRDLQRGTVQCGEHSWSMTKAPKPKKEDVTSLNEYRSSETIKEHNSQRPRLMDLLHLTSNQHEKTPSLPTNKSYLIVFARICRTSTTTSHEIVRVSICSTRALRLNSIWLRRSSGRSRIGLPKGKVPRRLDCVISLLLKQKTLTVTP